MAGCIRHGPFLPLKLPGWLVCVLVLIPVPVQRGVGLVEDAVICRLDNENGPTPPYDSLGGEKASGVPGDGVPIHAVVGDEVLIELLVGQAIQGLHLARGPETEDCGVG